MSSRVSPILCIAAAITALQLAVFAPAVFAGGNGSVGKDKAQACAVCHGIDGLAKRPDAPHLAGESELYLKKQLEAFRSGKRQHEIMTIIAEGLDDEDIADLAAWYSGIKVTVELPEAGGQD